MPAFRDVPRPWRLLAPLSLLLVMLPAGAASAASPTITKVSPLKLTVGQQLQIAGTGFIAGKNRNTVVFKQDGKAAVFAKADSATTTRITMTVPAKLLPELLDASGAQGIRRFRLRVLARRLGNATAIRLSPQIGPPGAVDPAPAASPGAAADCDADGVPNSVDADDDNDLTPDTAEATYKTDPCKVDTDGDGISDTFEIQSALDLNLRALPYPGKRPYPNALDATDAGVDFDQDGLTSATEYSFWQASGGQLPLSYSDGTQTSDPASGLTDDLRDVDADGLTNWDETTGRMTMAWWPLAYGGEVQYTGSPLAETSAVDPDTDGDGVNDGQDDQDHDGYTNLDEIDRNADWGGGTRLWVHPYNPCLPDPSSRVCTLHPPFSGAWAPFPIKAGATFPLVWTPPVAPSTAG